MEFVGVQQVTIADLQVLYSSPCVVGQSFEGSLAAVLAYVSHALSALVTV